MPQRKDYDVYSGNQKVGEIWSEHPTKSDYESDLNMQIQMVDYYFDRKATWELHNNPEYKAKAAKLEKLCKVVRVIAVFLIIASVILAVMNIINREKIDSFLMFLIQPTVLFGLGMGLRYFDIDSGAKSTKPKIDWKGVFFMFAAWGVAFLVIYFLVACVLMKFVL